ncbi:helix-turn-helix transcriptional regulator, partial [Nocardia sp. NPDC049190]|uniref:helix-turn-helix transcriptional regulator n=1 Tax=Nocardia sp. NPDC049190 TaxID=3155650 RepID=UPI0033C3A054
GYDTNPEDDTSPVMDVGADLEAIENVCADDPEDGYAAVRVMRRDVEAILDRLADQSLVTVHITPTTVRYSLLESIRLFTRQRLAQRSTSEVDESARLAQRHRRYYRDKVVAAVDWFSPGEQNWANAAWDNIVTAIETSLTSGEPTLGLEISATLVALPIIKGSPREIRRWTERTLQATRTLTPQPIDLQIEALTLIGWLSLIQAQYEEAEQILEECAALSIRDPNVRKNWQHTPETDTGLPAALEFLWGAKLMLAHRDPRAITVLARAREKFAALGNSRGVGRSELYEAVAVGALGSTQQALKIAQRHLDHAIASGAGWAKAWAELAWAITLTNHGNPTEALAVGRTALAYQVTARDQWGTSFAVYIRTWSLAQIITDSIATGDTDRERLEALATETAHLVGGAATLPAGLGINIGKLLLVSEETDKAIDVARRVLGPDAFAAAYEQGSGLRPELGEVQRLALGTLTIGTTPTHEPEKKYPPSPWSALSAAEQEVATLAAAGWTNVTIAARRGNSTRTVDAQIAAILHKLAITSRDDIIDLVPDDRITRVRAEAAQRPPRTSEQTRRSRRWQ